MGKVRAKNVKTKEGTDFARKKVKVGRKVKRANITEIKVKSKFIHVPIQNQISFNDIEDTRVAISLLIKQLHHYSESTRTSALQKLKDILNTNSVELLESSFISLVLPEVIELIFNAEKVVRTVVIEVLSIMLSKYNSDDFLSVISVLITYICSGLTHLHKGIRKDSLILLKVVSDKYPHLLIPYLENILNHILTLIDDSFQSSTSIPLQYIQREHFHSNNNCNKSPSTTTSATMLNTPKSLSLTIASCNMKNTKGHKNSNSSKPATMFVLILEVLSSLLNNMYKISSSTSSDVVGSSHNNSNVDVQFDCMTSYNAVVVMQRISSNTTQGTGHNSNNNINNSSSSSISNVLSNEILRNVLQHMSNLWQLLVVNNNELSIDTIHILLPITTIISSIYQNNDFTTYILHTDWNALKLQLISTLFVAFPYLSQEALVSAAGSVNELQANRLVEQLNTTLCQLAFVHLSSIDKKICSSDADEPIVNELQDTASHYLLQRLNHYAETLYEMTHSNTATNTTTSLVITEFEKQVTITIFKSLQRMMSKNTTKSLQELLVLLHNLFDNFLIVPYSKLRSFNYMIKSAVECLCSIVDRIKSDLSDDFIEVVYVLLIQSVCKAIELILTTNWEHTSTLSRLIYAMLALIQGKAFSTDLEESSTQIQTCMNVLINTYKQFFQRYLYLNHPHKQPQYKSKHGFERCDINSQYRLLDLYVYLICIDEKECSMFDISEIILNYLITSECISLDIQSYFLRLLFERRQSMSLDLFMDLIVDSISTYITYKCNDSRNNTTTNTTANNINQLQDLPYILEFHKKWYVHEISSILSLMSSSVHPDKIIFYLKSTITTWISNTFKNNINNNTLNHNITITTTSAITNHSLCIIYSKCAILVIIEGLLKPWIYKSTTTTIPITSVLGTTDTTIIKLDNQHNVIEAVNMLIQWIIEIIVSLLLGMQSLTIATTTMNSSIENALELFIVETIARMISLPIIDYSLVPNTSYNNSSNTSNNNSYHNTLAIIENSSDRYYIIFKKFLNELLNHITATIIIPTFPNKIQLTINILKGIYQVIHCSRFNKYLLIIYRTTISTWLDYIITMMMTQHKEQKKVAKNILEREEEQQLILLQNIAKDIIASF